METLTRLRQVGSVAIYKGQFEALSNWIKELSERHKLICFLSGLRDEIRLPIRMLNPWNLSATFGLAKIQEEYLVVSKRSTKPWSDGIKTSILGPLPMIKNESKGTKLPIQKISPSQMEERRKRGCVTIVKLNGIWGISARLQGFSVWRVGRKKCIMMCKTYN